MSAPSTAPDRTGRGERVEQWVQVVILLVVGGTAAAASFRHVHDVAAAHGQPGWLAWADAVVLELMSIATGLEIRRRHRCGRPVGFVVAVLVIAVALSLAAQVIEAEASVVGWLAAALPALGFLACVKLVLTRQPSTMDSTELGTSTLVPTAELGSIGPVPAGQDADNPALSPKPEPPTVPTASKPALDSPATASPARRTAPVALAPVPPGAFTRQRVNGVGQ